MLQILDGVQSLGFDGRLLAALLFSPSAAYVQGTEILEPCTSVGGIQINFIIFLFQFVNIYVGSRITITSFSFIIAVLFCF